MIEFREPPRTGFELTWRFFGIRFRIFPSFFIYYGVLAAIVIYVFVTKDPLVVAIGTAIDVACITVAFLFIGFVQGLVYRSYGLRSAVVLREFSTGVYPQASPPYTIERIVVALAYPAAWFLLFAVVYYSDQELAWSRTSTLAHVVYLFLKYISLFWGIIGLLPIVPYSGGKVMLEILTSVFRGSGLILALVISIVTAIAYIVYSVAVIYGNMHAIRISDDVVLPPSIIVSIFFALSAMNNWQFLQIALAQRRQASTYDDYHDDRAPWEA